jgi:hypothetical protein
LADIAVPSAEPSVRLLRNALSILGAVLTTVSAVLFLTFFAFELIGWTDHSNPYLGIVFFIVLPAIFIFGLLVIPLGVWLERRRRMRGLPPSLREWPRFDFNSARVRTIGLIVLVLTPVNMLIASMGAYKGVEAMDSVGFCGQVCHEVMEPQFVAYQNGPHSRVKCVACHIGPGADWFVRSKLSGARQVYAVMLNTHSRPIPSPVHDLRPARETCEQCHWPTQFHGDKLETRYEYASDEANTESATTLQLRIGGVDAQGQPRGIHWHVAEQNAIEYVALDRERQQIGYVKLTSGDGEVREYYADGVTEDQLRTGERRQMDCVDCHNRPSHRFAATADRAVNEVIGAGGIAKDLPFIKREALAVLNATYPTREAAATEIEQRLTAFYRDQYPSVWASRREDVQRAVRSVQAVHNRNVFPAMHVTFGSYTNNIGHIDAPGCFRCHDDSHKTKSGAVISQNCETCHTFQ